METYQSGPYRIERRGEFSFVIPRQGGMLTDGVIYSDSKLFEASLKDGCPVQVANVAHLPGIVGSSIALPDIHSGYGFPIGGVAAFDADEGVVSPGGVGYDINCGVRVLLSRVGRDDLRGREDDLLESIYRAVPAGVGSKRSDLGIGRALFESCMVSGAGGAVEGGFGSSEDLDHIEGAAASWVPIPARSRPGPSSAEARSSALSVRETTSSRSGTSTRFSTRPLPRTSGSASRR